jgi:hypothetical protein
MVNALSHRPLKVRAEPCSLFGKIRKISTTVTTGSDSMVGTVRFETDEGWFENNAVGFETETLPGVIALSVSFENANIALESRPNWLHVTRAGQTIDRLSLTGFSYYWSRFTRCRAAKQAVVNERQRQEKLRNTIPINPFG